MKKEPLRAINDVIGSNLIKKLYTLRKQYINSTKNVSNEHSHVVNGSKALKIYNTNIRGISGPCGLFLYDVISCKSTEIYHLHKF